jgi:hypothetical protein
MVHAIGSARLLLILSGFVFACSFSPAFPEGSPIIAYQVGAFLDRKNADRLVEKLGAKDIVGDISRKAVGGKTFWAVTVAVSGIPFENLRQELLDAGFASFPVFRPAK